MDVVIENNPVINRVWNEWQVLDQKLSSLSKEKRMELYERYQWIFKKEKKGFVELEALYSSNRHKHNREELHRWFYVVCGYMLSRVHLGDNSYYVYLTRFKKMFNREKCTSKDFPKQVLLVLGMLGYITGLDQDYSYTPGGKKNHGYHYVIDKEKLIHWEYPEGCSVSYFGMPEWVVSKTSPITFKEYGKDYDRISWTLHPDWLAQRQYESIASVEVLEEGVRTTSMWMFNFKEYENYHNMTEERQNDLKERWLSYQKLRDLDCGIIGCCKDDSDKPDGKGYAGRFYNCMTNMKSEDRHKYLRLDGELVVEVDVSSAQPSFLGIMMYKETGVMSEWLGQALNGTFYEWIAEKTNTYNTPLTEEERKTIKKWMMQFMYACYQPNAKRDYGKPHKPTYEFRKTDDPFLCFQQRLCEFLKKSEPAIYNKIDWYKRNPVFREDKDLYKSYEDEGGEKIKKKIGQGKWCSMLSYDLVKMEVEYIKRCIHALPEYMKFWTIHDCICVSEPNSLETKAIMEKVSREMYGEEITLRLKRENTSEDFS